MRHGMAVVYTIDTILQARHKSPLVYRRLTGLYQQAVLAHTAVSVPLVVDQTYLQQELDNDRFGAIIVDQETGALLSWCHGALVFYPASILMQVTGLQTAHTGHCDHRLDRLRRQKLQQVLVESVCTHYVQFPPDAYMHRTWRSIIWRPPDGGPLELFKTIRA